MSNAFASQQLQQSSTNSFVYNSMFTNWLNNNSNNGSYDMTGGLLAHESIGSNKKSDQTTMLEMKTPCKEIFLLFESFQI